MEILIHFMFNIVNITEKGKNHFEVLPEGWLQVTHNSGLPIYMHKVSRVCSVSRPYFLGPGSLRVCDPTLNYFQPKFRISKRFFFFMINQFLCHYQQIDVIFVSETSNSCECDTVFEL